MEGNLLSLLLILFFLLLEGLFAGSEIAFVASDVNRIKQKAVSGSRSGLLVLRLLRNPEWFLATTLTGTDICIISGTVLATSISIDVFGPDNGQLISVLVMIPLILIFGEIIPKSIFRQDPEKMAVRFSWFIWAASRLLYPVVFLVSSLARFAVFLSGNNNNSGSHYITKQGLKYLLKEKSVDTDLRVSERDMVRRVFDFSESAVSRLIVPLSHVVSLEENATFRQAASHLERKMVHAHTGIPR